MFRNAGQAGLAGNSVDPLKSFDRLFGSCKRKVRAKQQLISDAVFKSENEPVIELPRTIVERGNIREEVRLLADEYKRLINPRVTHVSNNQDQLSRSQSHVRQGERGCKLQRRPSGKGRSLMK